MASTKAARTVTVTYKAIFTSLEVPITFDITFCHIPELASTIVQGGSKIDLSQVDKAIFDINNPGAVSYHMLSVVPTACNFSYAMSYSDAAIGAWFTFDSSLKTLTLTADHSVTSKYSHEVDATFTATNIAGSTSYTAKFYINNCKYETFTKPVREDLYVLKGETITDKLLVADWSIPHTFCEPYSFRVEMSSNDSSTKKAFGMPAGVADSSPGWLSTTFLHQTTT